MYTAAALPIQKTVSAYFTSLEILPFGFARQYICMLIVWCPQAQVQPINLVYSSIIWILYSQRTRYIECEYFFMSLSAQSWQYGDRGKPETGTMLYSFEWPQGLFIVHSTIDSTAHSMPKNSLEHATLSQSCFNVGPSFADDGSTLKQHWVNVSCLLPYIIIIGNHSKLETFPGVGLLPNQRLRRWANIKPTLDKYIFCFLGIVSSSYYVTYSLCTWCR